LKRYEKPHSQINVLYLQVSLSRGSLAGDVYQYSDQLRAIVSRLAFNFDRFGQHTKNDNGSRKHFE
jgi:hypothetical protein